MNMKEVSIIIPIYNVEKYVAECLNSVISQTYDHSKIECIIVDDCTPDRSMDIVNGIIENFKGEMTFVLHKHEHNQGLSAARNSGMDIATGDYLYFMDSDDYISEDCLECMQQCAKQYQADIVYARHKKFEDGQSVSIQNEKNDLSISVVEKEQIIERLMRVGPWCDENVVISCNKLYFV